MLGLGTISVRITGPYSKLDGGHLFPRGPNFA